MYLNYLREIFPLRTIILAIGKQYVKRVRKRVFLESYLFQNDEAKGSNSYRRDLSSFGGPLPQGVPMGAHWQRTC